jgi:hypothetical protein
VDAGEFRRGGGLFYLGLALEEKDIEGFAEGCLECMGEDETLTRSDSVGNSGRTSCGGRWYSKASRPIVRPGRGGLRVIEVYPERRRLYGEGVGRSIQSVNLHVEERPSYELR